MGNGLMTPEISLTQMQSDLKKEVSRRKELLGSFKTEDNMIRLIESDGRIAELVFNIEMYTHVIALFVEDKAYFTEDRQEFAS